MPASLDAERSVEICEGTDGRDFAFSWACKK